MVRKQQQFGESVKVSVNSIYLISEKKITFKAQTGSDFTSCENVPWCRYGLAYFFHTCQPCQDMLTTV